MQFTPLQTARLTLRPYEISDISALVPIIGSREVAATTLRIPHPYTEAYAREFIAGAQEDLESGKSVRLAIIVSENGLLCGGIGLQINKDHHHAELGYWIGLPYWRNGYATEAARAVVQYGFETLGLNRIYASHSTNNPASGNVLRKLGMRHEGTQRQHIMKWGEFLDLDLYAILKSDYESAPVRSI